MQWISSLELLNITFLRAGMSNIGLYPEELNLSVKTKMKRIYQRFLKQLNGDKNYLRCSYLRDNNFEILCVVIALDKLYHAYADTVREKLTINYEGSITYSNTIYFLV